MNYQIFVFPGICSMSMGMLTASEHQKMVTFAQHTNSKATRDTL